MTTIAADSPPLVSPRAPLHPWFLGCCYAFAVLSAAYGVVGQFKLIPNLAFLGWHCLLTEWIVRDSSARGRPIPLLARDWLFWSAGVAGPAYVVWSRGWRGFGWLLLHTCLYWLVYAATGIVMWLFVSMTWN